MLLRQYSLNPCRPAYYPEIAENSLRPTALPVGGPINAGGFFPKGSVIGPVAGAAANEVWTITIGTATGIVTFNFVGDKVYSTSFPVIGTTAVVQAALENVFGTGNVAVTGTPGTTYTLTFQKGLANRLMGGLVTMTASTANPTLVRTTPGSCGEGQSNAYNNTTVPTARSILKYEYSTDPAGGLANDIASTGQMSSASVYTAGYFWAADLPGLDAGALGDPGWRLVDGNAFTDPNAVVGLGV